MQMVSFQHYGLFFAPAQVAAAQKYAKREPYQLAWEQLHQPPLADPISALLWEAFRYRFDEDKAVGAQAAEQLLNDLQVAPAASFLDQMMVLLVRAQIFELVRDHPAATEALQDRWLLKFGQQIEHLNETQPSTYVEQIWLALLKMAAGVVLEHEDLIQDSAAFYRQVIETAIHPRGYLLPLTESTAETGLQHTLLALKGLVLLAECGQQIGLDLWQYSQRNVSLVTAGLYPLYYYFYPEKWQWTDGLDQPEAERLFRLHGSYLEPLNRHIGKPTRAIDLILKDLRPVVDVQGGGMLTLSHGVVIGRGPFGLF
ncbi:MAG: alginate lyase family protein [Anaerolineae bacterium]|nr:alginate lyase family protein [Anaerolineae bacterium]